MKATTILMDEHRVIERVLAALELGARRLETGAPVRPGFFAEAAEFIRGFADGCHHRKEEGVLFKVMAEHGVPTQGGPIGVMLMEHEQARGLTRAMRDAAHHLESGDDAARSAVARNALDYVALLRQHIAKEDNVLFPLAEQAIPTGQHAGLLEAYEQVEHEETGEGVHERYLDLAQRLEAEMRG